MGRPLSKQQLFGANANNNIKVQFHNGTTSVKGYIIEQTGSKRFKCEDIDGNTAVCYLVDKASADLAAGEMTITFKYDDGTIQQATKITRHRATFNYNGSVQSMPWNFDTSTTDGVWQVEEAGTNASMANSVDLEGDDFDTTYPVPGSGTYKTAATAFTGVSYADIGTPATASGGVTTVSNSASGLFRSKYNGNLGTAPGDALNTWNFSFFGSAQHLADVADTYVSWGQQSDGAVLGQQNFSMEWKGYVKVPTTQKWNFYSQSDDDNAVWIGANALSGYTSSNNDLYNSNKTMPGNAAQCGPAKSLTMDSTKWYPIRIWMTEYNGGCNFQIFAIGQDGTKLNGSDLQWSYNTGTNGY